jgi:hypothetical protein
MNLAKLTLNERGLNKLSPTGLVTEMQTLRLKRFGTQEKQR